MSPTDQPVPEPSKSPKPVPSSFLPPPKRKRPHFIDGPLLEAPAALDPTYEYRRRKEMEADAWPDGLPHERRQWAAAVACLLVGSPGRERPLDWEPSDRRKRRRS